MPAAGFAEKQMLYPTKPMRALTILLLLCSHATALFAADSDQSRSTDPSDQSRTELNKLFAGFSGYDGDPNIKGFREHGSNAVVYLAEKVRRHDDLFKRTAILVYTNLPSGVASRIRPPVSLTPDQIKAVGILRQMGPAYTRQEAAVEALTVALGDSSKRVRMIAQGALGDIGPAASNAVPALIDSVEHAELNAIWALGRIGAHAKTAVPSLQRLLATGQSREKVYAAEALCRIGPGDFRALSCLQNGLTDTNRQARAQAAEALRGLGTNAQSALPALRRALPDRDLWARFCVARALVELGPRDEQAVAVLLETLANQNRAEGFRRLLAAQSLLQLHPPPSEALEFIKRALQEPDERVRLNSAWLMAERGVEIPSVLPALTQILNSSTDYRSLVLATKVAGLIGPSAISLRSALQKLTASKDEELRSVAGEALLRVQQFPSTE
jgi:HEAT repeat protein